MEVAVVGGGWSGCAAALTLAERGHRVTLFESGERLGGRARTVVRDGLAIDNGAHLLLGAYRQTLRLVQSVHAPERYENVLERRPLALVPAEGLEGAVSLAAPSLPAPLGLLVALARAEGLSLADRAGVVRWFGRLALTGFRRPPGETVERMIASGPRAAANGLWKPLCLAALNTPAERACAQTFANVLKAAFGRGRTAADLVLPRADLSAIFPDAAADRLRALGSCVETRCTAQVASATDAAVSIRSGGRERIFGAAIVAVAPHQLARAFADEPRASWPPLRDALRAVERLTYEPIATVWLGFRSPVRLRGPMLRLDDAPGQWLFDRPDLLAASPAAAARLQVAQLVAVVISGSGEHAASSRDALADAVEAQLRRAIAGVAPSTWRHVIRERRATHASTPESRPPPGPQVHPRVVLAGDYLDAEFPATLEAAVRMGQAAGTRFRGIRAERIAR